MKKMNYLIDCYKETVSFPFVKTRDDNYFNYAALYKQNIPKELRRVTWLKEFNTDYYRQMFQKLDTDTKTMITLYQQLYNVAEEMHEHQISNYAADRLAAHKKTAWMVRSILKT